MSHGVWVQRTPWTAYNVQAITMFHGAWMSGRSLLAGGSGHIYAGYKSVPCGMDEQTVSPVPKTLWEYGFCSFGHRKMYVWPAARYFELIGNSGGAFNWDRKCTSGEFSF